MEYEGIGTLNPGRNNNVRIQATKSFLEGNSIITLGTFLAGHIAENRANIGGFVKIAGDIWTVAMQATTDMRNLKAMSLGFERNIFMNKLFIVDAYGMFSSTMVLGFFNFGSYHAGLTCNSYYGHGITVNAYHMPDTELTSIGAEAKVNLWTTEETQLYFTAKVLRTFSTEFPSTSKFSCGISFGLNF